MTSSDPPTGMPTDQHRIENRILDRSRDHQLTCAVAFDIAASLDISPAAVGETADRLNVRLIKCQLGLFGYRPEKKIVSPATEVSTTLREAIRAGCHDGRLPCKTAWQIAAAAGMAKMAVAGACEALAVKIKPCQLGAF